MGRSSQSKVSFVKLDVTISALTEDDFLLYQYAEEAVDMTTLRTYLWDQSDDE